MLRKSSMNATLYASLPSTPSAFIFTFIHLRLFALQMTMS